MRNLFIASPFLALAALFCVASPISAAPAPVAAATIQDGGDIPNLDMDDLDNAYAPALAELCDKPEAPEGKHYEFDQACIDALTQKPGYAAKKAQLDKDEKEANTLIARRQALVNSTYRTYQRALGLGLTGSALQTYKDAWENAKNLLAAAEAAKVVKQLEFLKDIGACDCLKLVDDETGGGDPPGGGGN